VAGKVFHPDGDVPAAQGTIRWKNGRSRANDCEELLNLVKRYTHSMPRFDDDNFSRRRESADKAKKALLERFRAQPSEDDPATIARKAAQLAVSAAREVRSKERAQIREEAAQRHKEEAARLKQAQLEQDAAESRAEADRKAGLLAMQKTARDARYAARKSRGR
jgi:hypothetical protein